MKFDHTALTRFGGGPLLLSPEHLARFERRPMEDTANERATARARATVMSAAKRAGGVSFKDEFTFTGWTCGYFKTAEGLAIVPIWGDLGPARAFWPWVYYEDIIAAADAVAKDGDVKAVLYFQDSPGGYVAGLSDCAAAIEATAKIKPSATYAQDLSASAAYWLACASSRLTAPATGVVGSIGSLCVHEEYSKLLEDAGVAVSVIRSAPRKAEANPFEPLSQAARQQLQAEVTACADDFIANVSRLRSLDETAIRATQAACLLIEPATAGGFADGSESFDQACAALLARAAPPHPAPPAAAVSPAASTKPARGKSAKQQPAAKPSARAQTRSSAMDPTTLPEEEQIARRDEIATIVAEEPADDAGKIGQFVQVVAVVNRPAEEGGEEETDPAETPAEEPAAAKALAAARAIATSKEAKDNPTFALAAIAQGLTLKSFKALAPTAGKSKASLDERMRGQSGAHSVGDDPKKKAAAEAANVTALDPAGIYARRAKAAGGKK